MQIYAVVENYQECSDGFQYNIGKQIIDYFKSEAAAQAEIDKRIESEDKFVSIRVGDDDSFDEDTYVRYGIEVIEVKD
jgi:hypothetical protein